MSAPNSKFIWRTFGANDVRQIAPALKGKAFSAKRAIWARVLAHIWRFTLQGGVCWLVQREAAMDKAAHVLNCNMIEELDEMNDDTQLCWVWCETHRKFEWHSLHFEYVKNGGIF
jgi:hypothetical protein